MSRPRGEHGNEFAGGASVVAKRALLWSLSMENADDVKAAIVNGSVGYGCSRCWSDKSEEWAIWMCGDPAAFAFGAQRH